MFIFLSPNHSIDVLAGIEFRLENTKTKTHTHICVCAYDKERAINSCFIWLTIWNFMEAKRPYRTSMYVAYLNTASPPTPSPLKAKLDDTLLTSGLPE